MASMREKDPLHIVMEMSEKYFTITLGKPVGEDKPRNNNDNSTCILPSSLYVFIHYNFDRAWSEALIDLIILDVLSSRSVF